MSRRMLPMVILFSLTATLAACDDDETGPDEERFVATLTGASERPAPVTTNATGSAELVVEENGTVTYSIDVQNISAVTAAHIHGPATTEEAAGVLVSLFPIASSPTVPTGAVSGRLVQGTFTASDRPTEVSLDSVLTLIRSGRAYVNVHTSANRAGEIRGQIVPG